MNQTHMCNSNENIDKKRRIVLFFEQSFFREIILFYSNCYCITVVFNLGGYLNRSGFLTFQDS